MVTHGANVSIAIKWEVILAFLIVIFTSDLGPFKRSGYAFVDW